MTVNSTPDKGDEGSVALTLMQEVDGGVAIDYLGTAARNAPPIWPRRLTCC